jgi:hypothetical protein
MAVFFLRPARLEELLIYMAVFEAAAVVNLGGGFSVGLSPYFFTASLLAIRIGAKWNNGRIRFKRGEFTQNHLQIAAIFILWCVISAFVLPVLFEGTPVDSPRAGVENVSYMEPPPLKWTFSNAGQAGYMVLNFFALLALADFCTSRPLNALMDAFSYSGGIVALIGLYQMMTFHTGLPFPSSFLNSNGTYGQNYSQRIGNGWHRVSSTFVEPSSAGAFLSCWVVFELLLSSWGAAHRTRHGIFTLLGGVVLLATTATTGYVTIGLVMAFIGGRLAVEVVGRGRIPIRISLTVAAIAMVALGFFTLGHGSGLLNDILWKKANSASGVGRWGTVRHALVVLQDTYGLGAGLGSNRAFGALAYIGSNLGVFGLIVFSYMQAQLLSKSISIFCFHRTSLTDRVAIIACVGAFLTNLIAAMVSGAEISSPRMWLLWGMLLASLRTQYNISALRGPNGLLRVAEQDAFAEASSVFRP